MYTNEYNGINLVGSLNKRTCQMIAEITVDRLAILLSGIAMYVQMV